MKAKKSLGQHFLRSEKALRTIIESSNLSNEDLVLEIGPGEGVLTEKILETGAKVVAVEKDDNLFEKLGEKFSKEIASGELNLIHEDILDFNPKTLSPYKLVANIPYNITGAIIEKFLSEDNQPLRMVLLVQKEVAERIVARDEKESILSISVKVYGTPRYIEKVLAGSFVPAPKVDSAIIVVENISKNFFLSFSEIEFFKFLKTGFQSKRKKLSSNLSVNYDKKIVLETFKELNINENIRAENVPIEMWGTLYKAICTS
jgi:16S rRNA (adenine1518-N6/adenine1519-N6)-dimethyltransferase